LVDDEPDLEPLVKRRMRRDIRAGTYEFVFAEDGLAAVELLEKDKDIDIVVTDINMPRMDGLTLLSRINDINPDTLSIVVSTYGDMPNIRTAMNRGAFDFVTKTLDFQDFRVTISRTVNHLSE
jgi:DNA-binding NtrC family response regulator